MISKKDEINFLEIERFSESDKAKAIYAGTVVAALIFVGVFGALSNFSNADDIVGEWLILMTKSNSNQTVMSTIQPQRILRLLDGGLMETTYFWNGQMTKDSDTKYFYKWEINILRNFCLCLMQKMEQKESIVGLCRAIKMEKMKIIGTMLISAHLNGVISRNIQVNMICLCGYIPNTLVQTYFFNMGS